MRSILLMKRCVIFVFVLAGSTICPSWLFAQVATSPSSPPYLNPTLPIDQRVEDLVSRMTLEEKASQLVNQARAIPRLQVPEYDYWSEALHGVAAAGVATVFPQAIALGATWDAPLLHNVATVIGTEARAKHHESVRQGRRKIFEGLTFWSPNINIFRDPRWGRGQETYGEDPFLTGRMGVAFVTGLQGDDPKYFRVISTPKHYAVHSGPEPSRHVFDVHPNDSDLLNTYLPAFKAAIVEGKADSVMCAYNRVDGVPACANTDLLEKRLRGDWGFTGYVVSDCGAIADIFRFHKYKPNAAEASAVAVKAGTDLTCGTEYRALVETYEPKDARYLTLHRGHLAFVRPEERHFVTGERIRSFTLTGTVDEITERVRQLRDGGFDQLTIQLVPGEEGAIEDWARVVEKVGC